MPLDSMPVVDFLTRVTDDNGDPVAGGTIYFYDAGTNTPKEVFADADLSTSLGTSVTLDASGYPVTGGSTRTMIYVGTDPYKVVVKDADATTLITHDDIPGAVTIPTTSAVALPSTPVITKTAAYTIVSDDRAKVVNCVPTSASFVVTLPSAVTVADGWRICIRHDGTANTVTINTVSAQTISFRGAAPTTLDLTQRGESIWLVSNGSNWLVDADSVAFIGTRDDVSIFEFDGDNETERLEAAATYADTNGLWVDLEGRTITLTASGAVAPRKFRNGTIDATAVTNTRVMPEAGSYIAALYVTGGDMFGASWASTTVTGALSKGATTVTVASTSGFAIGDEIIIHKAVQWGNSASSGYYSEAAVVLEITSGTVLRIAGGLKQAYSGSAPATTVRKFPTVDVHWKDLKIVGSQLVDDVFGGFVTHARRAMFDNVRVEGTRRTGVAAFGCYNAVFDRCSFERCDQGGLGYGLLTNSTDGAIVANCDFDRCREGVSGGGNFGTGRALTWSLQVSNCRFAGMSDAAINQHPGCVDAVVSNNTIGMDPTATDEYGTGATSDGDAIFLQSVTAAIVGNTVRNQRRHAIHWEPVTPGDTSLTLSLNVSGCSIASSTTVSGASAVAASMASASSTAVADGVVIDQMSSRMVNGILLAFEDSLIKKFAVSQSTLVATGDSSTLNNGVIKVQTSTIGATRPPSSVSVSDCYIECPITTSGYYGIFTQGIATAVLPHVSISGVRTEGGQYGLAGEHCTIDRWSHRHTGGTGSTTAGTGCTINSTHST